VEVTSDDLLLLIGKKEAENFALRRRLAQLEEQQTTHDAVQHTANGVAGPSLVDVLEGV
jgi:hypothetical protein